MKLSHQLTAQFTMIQCFYWISFSSIFAFAAVYLRDCGFDNQQIGITLAVGYLAALLIQPIAASFADLTRKIRLNQLCAVFAGVLLISVIALAVFPKIFPVVILLFILIETLLLVLQPFLYSLGLNFINQGIAVNFGLARGLGSGAFALASLTLGVAIDDLGSPIILVTCAVTTLLMIAFILSIKTDQATNGVDSLLVDAPVTQARLPENTGQFLARYPGFSMILIGLVLIMTNLNMYSNYLIHIVERIGGTSQTLGMATALAAVLEIPVMGYFSLFVKKISARKLLRIASLFFIVKALATLLAANVDQFLMTQFFQAGAYALYLPASVFYVNGIMEAGDVVKGQAFLGVTFTLGGIIGSLLGGALLDIANVQATMIASLGITLIGAILLYRGTRPIDRTRGAR